MLLCLSSLHMLGIWRNVSYCSVVAEDFVLRGLNAAWQAIRFVPKVWIRSLLTRCYILEWTGFLIQMLLNLLHYGTKDLRMLCCLLKDTVCTWTDSRINVKVTEKKDRNINWSVMKHSTCLNVRAPNTATTGLGY